MRNDFRNFFKVGIVHFMAYPETMRGEGPILETVWKIAADDYFDVIEITRINDQATRLKVREMLTSAKMTAVFGAQPILLSGGYNLNDLDEQKRRLAVDNIKHYIDEAREMNCASIGILSGKYEEATKERAFEQLLKSCEEVCAYAEQAGGMKVALEVFDYDVDKKSLIGPAYLAKKIGDCVRRKFGNFGLMVDLSHIPQLHESNEESLVPVKEHIIHAHMGNCVITDPHMPAYGDQHPRFGFPGGVNDADEVAAYLRALFDVGYLGRGKCPVLSFEVKPYGGEDPDLVIANAKRTLNAAWCKVENLF